MNVQSILTYKDEKTKSNNNRRYRHGRRGGTASLPAK